MVFSSIRFLFFFLPLLFLCYYVAPKRYRNVVLLLFIFVFYYFSEKEYLLLLLVSCFLSYLFGMLLEKKKTKGLLFLGIFFHLGLLIYFKYMNFFLQNVTHLFGLSSVSFSVILPLGISFFTFQNISYLVDVYRGNISREKSFFGYCTYISFFPQLVAGPIVRYQDISHDLSFRRESIASISEGIQRFVFGLAKKVLIADALFLVYEPLFSSPSFFGLWICAILILFQIYYDFSGYSDMAIGLGKMFGFSFPENFDYPLVSASITEFWRKWHMTLSSFFRDYVYIPLGGNRVSKCRHIFNLFVVWLLTGLWHGASWNFILWGIYFFVFLTLEKYVLKRFLHEGIFSHFYTFVVVLISFVIFQYTDFETLFVVLKGMMGIGVNLWNSEFFSFCSNHMILFMIACFGISPFLKKMIQKLQKGRMGKVMEWASVLVVMILFLISVSSIISSSFHPFIYFRF